MLITSFVSIINAPIVLTVLPQGGDSRRQFIMIFVPGVVGCCAFVTYAASLFFRFKSRETGIFMILGASKKFLKRQITWDFRSNWKYAPRFRVLDYYDFLTSFAVFLVLFMFIAIICFAAVLIIGYIRCITIAMNNRQV